FSPAYGILPHLPSFPTRRSSDLVTSRSMIALAEPGSCFSGFLAEFLFAADRAYMFIGSRDGDNRPEAAAVLTASNFGPLTMPNRSEEHTSELQSRENLVCRLLLE